MSVKQRLIDFMVKTGMKQKQVAAHIGKSITVVSLYLNDRYTGDVQDVESAIERMLKNYDEKVKDERFQSDFVATVSAKKAIEVMRFAHLEGEINVIYGAAGLGKTKALKKYAEDYPEAILIEVEPSYSAKVLLKVIAKRLGVAVSGNLHDLMTEITTKLSGSSRVILVDEAELLPLRALECLRRINDLAGVGIVLAGMPRLLINLKGKKGELAQLYSRVAFACNLGNELGKSDIGLLAENGLGTDEFNAELYKASRGNARRLNKLVRGVIRSSEINEQDVTVEMIRHYAEMLIH